MQNSNRKTQWVYKFTNPTFMKFQPLEDFQVPPEPKNEGLITRIRNYFSPPKNVDPPKPTKKPRQGDAVLKFLKALTNQDVLIGNQDQLDAICIGHIVADFVDTQLYWSLNVGRPILHVAIDKRKSNILLLPEKEVLLFNYDPKNMQRKPSKIGSVRLSKDVRFIQVVKEGHFILCYPDSIEVFTIDQNTNQMRVSLSKQYRMPNDNIKLFRVPPPSQNSMTLFFQQQKGQNFAIWGLDVQFLDREVKVGKPTKVKQFPLQVQESVDFAKFSKQGYFIIVESKIYMVRKGYVLDMANTSAKVSGSRIYFISSQRLIHISDIKVQVYESILHLDHNPPTMQLKSIDSILLPQMPYQTKYFSSVPIFGQQFGVFYQLKEPMKMGKGELKYSFLLAYLMKREDKLRNILPDKLSTIEIQKIEQKADMANKMGMERKDIYLRLWNSCNKTSVQDFKILLDTLDYDTIKQEIEKKLKKNSMNFRELLLIQQGCFSMLQENVYGPKPDLRQLKNYLSSHFFIRELQFFKTQALMLKKQGKKINEDKEGKMLFNIQDYNSLKNLNVQTNIIELIGSYCIQNKNHINTIRLFIRFFRFPLRVVYFDILKTIIVSQKKKFIKILQAIPQLLPYVPGTQHDQQIDPSIYQGIWNDIAEDQWTHHLFIDNLQTFDNKEMLNELASSVWYKRFWLTYHEYIHKTKQEIMAIHRKNMSDRPFYLALQWIFQYITQPDVLRTTIDFIQDKYPRLPNNLLGKIFLYHKMYQYFQKSEDLIPPQQRIPCLAVFLQWHDPQLFKAIFAYQKIRKSFILQQIKPLYQKQSSIEVFNQGLLNYFASDLSNISDIKFLLNRLNNKKIQFHEKHQGLYEVLVRGMQLKLTMGTGHDIPIQEVLIYIQNIPIASDNCITVDLSMMKLINQQREKLRNAKLNMSLFRIMRNYDQVLPILIKSDIEAAGLKQSRNSGQFSDIGYNIVSSIASLSGRLYSDTHHQLIMFSFLTCLLQQPQLIPIISPLIKEGNCFSYSIGQKMVQNMVIYMYKWQLINQPSFLMSSSYLQALFTLLPQENQCRQHLHSKLSIALALSTPDNHVKYPISQGLNHFTITCLQKLISSTKGQHLLQVDLQNLHLHIQIIQKGLQIDIIPIKDLYELVIIQMIKFNLLKACIPKIRRLVEVEAGNPNNFVYSALLIFKLGHQLVEENKILLLDCANYMFNEPLQLLNLLQQLMSKVVTSNQMRDTLIQLLEAKKKTSKSYNQSNALFERQLIKQIDSQYKQKIFQRWLKEQFIDLRFKREKFASIQYYLAYMMICQQPYTLPKFVYILRNNLRWKQVRAFFGYLSRKPFFNRTRVLQFAKRHFFCLLTAVRQNRNISDVVNQIKDRSLSEPMQLPKISSIVHLQKKLIKGVQYMKSKLKFAGLQIQKKRSKGQLQTQQQQLNTFRACLQHPPAPKTDYGYLDSDDNPAEQSKLQIGQEKASEKPVFDPALQRHRLIKRNDDKVQPYFQIAAWNSDKQFFDEEKQAKNYIFTNLSIDKKMHAILDQHNQEKPKNDAIRNSIRRSRSVTGAVRLSQSKNRQSGDKEVFSQHTSNELTVVKPESKNTTQPLKLQTLHEQATYEQNISVTLNSQKKASEEEKRNTQLAHDSILVSILGENSKISEDVVLDFQTIKGYVTHPRYKELLQNLMKSSFQRQEISLQTALIFAKQLAAAHPTLNLNLTYWQIYNKMVTLSSKFVLDLPLKKMLLPDGLLIEGKSHEPLFQFMLPYILSSLSQDQLIKTCKVVTLAFKKSQLEQEILIAYWRGLSLQYQAISTEGDKQLKMLGEKMGIILDKISVRLLKKRQEQLLSGVKRNQKILQNLVLMMINSCERRHDTKMAQYFKQKYQIVTPTE